MGLITARYQITCDHKGCESTGPLSSTPGDARTQAHFSGFKVEKYPSNGALCAIHKPKEDE